MQISLITIPYYFQIYYRYLQTNDTDRALSEFEDLLSTVAECGYNAVDVTSEEVGLFTKEQVRMLLDKCGLKASSYIHMIPFDMIGTEGRKAAKLAAFFQTKVLMYAPQANEKMSGLSAEEVRSRLTLQLKEAVSYADVQGITPGVEDTPDIRLGLCGKTDFEKVFAQVPELRMVYDSGNMLLSHDDPVDFCNTFLDKTVHVHLKDMRLATEEETYADKTENGTGYITSVFGQGLIDFRSILCCLQSVDYQGYLSVEPPFLPIERAREDLLKAKKHLDSILSDLRGKAI